VRIDEHRLSGTPPDDYGFHDFHGVKRHLVGRSVRPICANRSRHLGNSKNSIIAIVVTVGEWQLAPRPASSKQPDPTSKEVRIRNQQTPLGPVDLDWQVTVPLHIETCMKTDDCPLLKLQKSIKMGWDFDREFFALLRARSKYSLDKTSPGDRRHPRYRPDRLSGRLLLFGEGK
jgi:hypothetical protein